MPSNKHIFLTSVHAKEYGQTVIQAYPVLLRLTDMVFFTSWGLRQPCIEPYIDAIFAKGSDDVQHF